MDPSLAEKVSQLAASLKKNRLAGSMQEAVEMATQILGKAEEAPLKVEKEVKKLQKELSEDAEVRNEKKKEVAVLKEIKLEAREAEQSEEEE